MILLDTDIASAFAKAKYFDVFIKYISPNVYISKSVFEELQVPLSFGYLFPEVIMNNTKILFLDNNEENLYLQIRSKYEIGRGESESIAISKSRQIAFSSFDRLALNAADKEECIVIPSLAIFLQIKNSISLEKTIQIVEAIEEADRRDLKFIKSQLDKY